MKRAIIDIFYFILIFICISGHANAQLRKEIKIVNGVTGRPVPDLNFTIFKNYDTKVTFDNTNKKGLATIVIKDSDTVSNYGIAINDQGYLPSEQKIDIRDKKTTIISILIDQNYRPRKKRLVYSECLPIFFPRYFAREPHSLSDLPDSIRKKVEKYLKDTLGEAFYTRLKLTGGQLVDLDRFPIIDKTANGTEESYYLCFSFADLKKGLGGYTAKIELDKYGNVKYGIEFPDVKNHPEKADIISIRKARRIAFWKGYFKTGTSVKFEYDYKSSGFVWKFEHIRIAGWKRHIKILTINANSGKVLREEFWGGIIHNDNW